jgi:hypothetical protein
MTAAEEENTLVLKELAGQIAGSTKTTHHQLQELTKEVQDIRDTRMRPYLTSMGLFVVMVMGVTGYVYNVELRFTRAFFTIQDRMQVLEIRGEVNTGRDTELSAQLRRMEARRAAKIDEFIDDAAFFMQGMEKE